jgi:type III pantothenate kinase
MTMTLVIDMGNSRFKWGLFADGAWRQFGHIANQALNTVILTQWKSLPSPDRIVGACVAGEPARIRIQALMGHWRVATEWLTATRECAGVVNSYDRPETLGADRWAALIAARRLQLENARGGRDPAPCLHISFGTAAVIDSLDSDGVFLGGMILPNLPLMRKSLAQSTAALPLSLPEGKYVEFPRNSSDAIFTGTIEATAGLVERARAKLAARRGLVSAEEVSVYVGGGFADQMIEYLPQPAQRVENLVLDGVRIAFGVE